MKYTKSYTVKALKTGTSVNRNTHKTKQFSWSWLGPPVFCPQ